VRHWEIETFGWDDAKRILLLTLIQFVLELLLLLFFPSLPQPIEIVLLKEQPLLENQEQARDEQPWPHHVFVTSLSRYARNNC